MFFLSLGGVSSSAKKAHVFFPLSGFSGWNVRRRQTSYVSPGFYVSLWGVAVVTVLVPSCDFHFFCTKTVHDIMKRIFLFSVCVNRPLFLFLWSSPFPMFWGGRMGGCL
jgi:hypothetical protein